MKTTLELPDDLLIEAKAVAAQRRTTLRAIIEHALRREIQAPEQTSLETDSRYEKNELGFFVLKKRPGAPAVTTETIRHLQEQMEKEELDHALKLAGHR